MSVPKVSRAISFFLLSGVLISTIVPAYAYGHQDTRQAREFLFSNEPLKTIIVANYYPYTFVNQEGQPDGFSVDLMQAVAQVMGLELEIQVDTWDRARHALENGEIDFLPMMAYSSERDQYFDFSVPHTIAYDAFFVRKGAGKIRSIDDLRGKTIIVMENDQAHDYLRSISFIKTEQLVLIDSLPKALRLLASGTGDTALMPKLVGLLLIKDLNLSNLEMAPAVIEAYKRPFSFAVKDGNQALLERLSQGLSIVKATEQYGDIYEKWFGALEPPSLLPATVSRYFGAAILGFTLIGCLLLLWSFSLKRQVSLRTRSLEIEIQERKHAEDALRESEERYRTLAKESPNGIMIHSAGKVVFVNPQAMRLLGGTTESEFIGRTPLSFLHPDYHQAVQERIQKVYDKIGPARPLEEKFIRLDGTVIDVEVAATMLDWEGKPASYVVFQDTTERKRTEDELRKYHESLEKLVKERTAELTISKDAAEEARRLAEAANQAKSVFLTNMSHELRTPLNAILGFTQLMRRDQTLAPGQRKNLRIIHHSSEHLLELLNDVLEMSKIEAGRATFIESDFDLYKLLDGLESMFIARAQDKGLWLRFERAPGVPQYVRTDERKLRQTLINLLDNAIKFTEQGGVTLRVMIDGERDRDRELDASLSLSPISICFEVQDTGTGIAPGEKDKLFEAFTQTASGQKVREGTGLGLALSRRFVQLMGGDLSVQSPPPTGESGSVFRLDVQVGIADVGMVQKRQTRRRVVGLAPGQRAYRILIAEDIEASRALLVQLLEAVGFEVRAAANGQEALAVCQTWNPHLIWMDVRMPVMDGYEATQRIKAPNSNTQYPIPTIIALTAHAFEEERTAILAAGCDGFVRKPFREAEIFDKMAEHLDVQYVYEELDQPAGEPIPPALKPADLAALPTAWVADLRQAAMAGEARQVLELIEQIKEGHESLAAALTQLVHEFRFDKLVALTGQEST